MQHISNLSKGYVAIFKDIREQFFSMWTLDLLSIVSLYPLWCWKWFKAFMGNMYQQCYEIEMNFWNFSYLGSIEYLYYKCIWRNTFPPKIEFSLNFQWHGSKCDLIKKLEKCGNFRTIMKKLFYCLPHKARPGHALQTLVRGKSSMPTTIWWLSNRH